jgi:hypothetical protein
LKLQSESVDVNLAFVVGNLFDGLIELFDDFKQKLDTLKCPIVTISSPILGSLLVCFLRLLIEWVG